MPSARRSISIAKSRPGADFEYLDAIWTGRSVQIDSTGGALEPPIERPRAEGATLWSLLRCGAVPRRVCAVDEKRRLRASFSSFHMVPCENTNIISADAFRNLNDIRDGDGGKLPRLRKLGMNSALISPVCSSRTQAKVRGASPRPMARAE